MGKKSLKSLRVKAKREGWLEYVRTENDERALLEGYYLDLGAGRKVVEFIETFCFCFEGKFAGKPFLLMDWQKEELVIPLFGWKRPGGLRRFRRAFVAMPKKNGKSGLCSVLSLYMLIGDGEPGAEVYAVANDRKQAAIVFDPVLNIVNSSPYLKKRLVHTGSVNPNAQRYIVDPESNSRYVVLSRQNDSAEGKKAHFLTYDELHATKDKKLWDALRYAGRSRTQPISMAITTAGVDPLTVCRKEWDFAEDVLSGTVTDLEYFALIYQPELDPQTREVVDDLDDPEVWRKVNPSMGVIFSEEDFGIDYRRAKAQDDLNTFLRYSFNIWTKQTRRYIPMDKWKLCEAKYTLEELRGRTCYGGLDLSATRDLAAFSACFPYWDEEVPGREKVEPEEELSPDSEIFEDPQKWLTEGMFYRFLTWFWIPEESPTVKDSRYGEQYLRWRNHGLLEMIKGDAIDQSYPRLRVVGAARYFKDRPKKLAEWVRSGRPVEGFADMFDMQEIAYDPWNMSATAQNMIDHDGMKMTSFRQGSVTMNEPTKKLLRLILTGGIEHDGNEILTWNAGNLEVKEGLSQDVRPVKPSKDSPLKVDGIIAMIMALAMAILAKPKKPSVYRKRGVRTI